MTTVATTQSGRRNKDPKETARGFVLALLFLLMAAMLLWPLTTKSTRESQDFGLNTMDTHYLKKSSSIHLRDAATKVALVNRVTTVLQDANLESIADDTFVDATPESTNRDDTMTQADLELGTSLSTSTVPDNKEDVFAKEDEQHFAKDDLPEDRFSDAVASEAPEKDEVTLMKETSRVTAAGADDEITHVKATEETSPQSPGADEEEDCSLEGPKTIKNVSSGDATTKTPAEEDHLVGKTLEAVLEEEPEEEEVSAEYVEEQYSKARESVLKMAESEDKTTTKTKEIAKEALERLGDIIQDATMSA